MPEQPSNPIQTMLHPLEQPPQQQRSDITYNDNINYHGRSSCSVWFHACLKITHSAMIALLSAAVIWQGVRLHGLQKQLDATNTRMEELSAKVQNQQATQQDLNDKVEQEQNITIFQMASTFTLLTCLITCFHIYSHLTNFCKPEIQRKIIAILWMSPIYSVTSCLSLIVPSADGYLSVIKDCYEAYVIYQFLSFLIYALGNGDRDAAVVVLSRHADHLKRPTQCLSYHPPPESSNLAMAKAVLTECQVLAMQFVLVRPLTSILHFLVETFVDEAPEEERYSFLYNPSFYISMVTNVSVFFAFNGLLKFYHAVANDLEWIRPFRKFLSIKGIVFLTFWQGLLITIIVSLQQSEKQGTSGSSMAAPVPGPYPDSPLAPTMSPTTFEGATIDVFHNHTRRFLQGNDDNDQGTSSRERAAQIQNFLICLEMLFFSLAHWCVFPAEEWASDYQPKRMAQPGIALKDFAKDISYIINTRSNARAYRRGNSNMPGSELSSVEDGVVVDQNDLELHEMT